MRRATFIAALSIMTIGFASPAVTITIAIAIPFAVSISISTAPRVARTLAVATAIILFAPVIGAIAMPTLFLFPTIG